MPGLEAMMISVSGARPGDGVLEERKKCEEILYHLHSGHSDLIILSGNFCTLE